MIELPVIEAPRAEADTEGTKFWRSLPHLKNDADYQALARHEFMPEAMEAPRGSSRRDFLQIMGASMALAGLSACRRPVERILPYTRKPEEIIPGIPLNYATAMPQRGVVEAILVENHEGRPTKVEGNPQHPVSLGASGLFAQASVLNLYDPDRSQAVLQGGSTSTWADFLAFAQGLGRRASSLRLAVLCEESSSPTLKALQGALTLQFPNLQWVTYRPEGDDPERMGWAEAVGRPVRPVYTFSEASVIVTLDADFLGSTDRNMVRNTREFAAGRRLNDPSDNMSRLYAVESGYSITGGMADHRKRLRASDIPSFAAALAARLGVGSTGVSFRDDPFIAAIADDLRQAGGRGIVLAGETQPPEVHALCAAINSQLGSIGQAITLLDTTAGDTSDVIRPAPPQEAVIARAGSGSEEEVVEREPDAALRPLPVVPPSSLEALVASMNAGTVDALIMIGVNPVYDAPGDLDFAAALPRVADTVHVGLHVDETAVASRWHLPRSHYLEAWGDGRAYDGTLSVIQPLISPLYDTRSEIEVLNMLATGQDLAGYDLVRTVWADVITGDFEAAWRKVLHDGLLPGTAYPELTGATAQATSMTLSPPSPNEVEVIFRLSPTVLDGSYANNAWMQELPDPTNKIVWDNVATMSPATAERFGVGLDLDKGKYYADVVRLTYDGRSVDLPVWILPGHADNAITVTLGYGRTLQSNRAERHTNFFDRDDYTDIYGKGALANGVGVNVAPLRSASAMRVVQGVQVEKVGEGYLLATTQDHGVIQEEREEVARRGLFRMATLAEYRQDPGFIAKDEPKPIREPWDTYPELWDEDHPKAQLAFKDNPYYKNQWAMVIDLNSCTGCNACMVACQAENNIQVVGKEEVSRGRELHWIRMDRYFVSDAAGTDDPQMAIQPVPCMHCENAPCESVCPVAATVHSPDGTNQMIYNRCIGTRYCANNCPYKVRRFNYYNWSKTIPMSVHMAQNPNVTVRSRGVMEKCSFCIQRIREVNKQTNLEGRPIQDGEVVTACQQACPGQAITFGDQNDPNSAIVKAQANSRQYAMLAELNVKPRTTYLARVRNPNPALEAQA